MAETFARVEKKYLLDDRQYREILEKIEPYVCKDRYFKTTINSIYYDTKDLQLIRRSLEKPQYKEKLRIRSYGEPDEKEKVFVELKKKLDGIVYKRRSQAPYGQVMKDLHSCAFPDEQVGNEIIYTVDHYGGLYPAVYVGCERTSYTGRQDSSLRITFDQDIRYRMKDLRLKADGKKDIPLTDRKVMEIKVSGAMPLWLCAILDQTGAYPRGYSKVGAALMDQIKKIRGGERR